MDGFTIEEFCRIAAISRRQRLNTFWQEGRGSAPDRAQGRQADTHHHSP